MSIYASILSFFDDESMMPPIFYEGSGITPNLEVREGYFDLAHCGTGELRVSVHPVSEWETEPTAVVLDAEQVTELFLAVGSHLGIAVEKLEALL